MGACVGIWDCGFDCADAGGCLAAAFVSGGSSDLARLVAVNALILSMKDARKVRWWRNRRGVMGMARSGLSCRLGRVEQWESLYRVWWRRPLDVGDLSTLHY